MSRPERIDSPFGVAEQAARERAPARARLKLRGLTGWEEEHIESRAAEPNTARLCNEILARCLVAPGADPEPGRRTVRDLLVAERDRELVALRRLSLGPDISAQVSCSHCGEQSEADFSLDVLPLDFEPPEEPVRLELDGVGEVLLRLPTAGDQEDLLDAELAGDAERRTWLIARCLLGYGDRGGPFDHDFARSLPVAQRSAIELAIEERLPDLSLEMAVECSHCGAASTAPFDVPTFFFSS